MSNVELAKAKKAEGNTAFKARDLERAIQCYTEAIELDASDPTFFSNRSACYAGLEEWEKAAEDGRNCITCDRNFIKGYFRLALACQQLENYEEGISAIRRGLAVDASNRDLKNKLKELEDANRVVKVQRFLEAARKQNNAGDFASAIKSAEAGLRMDSSVDELRDILNSAQASFDQAERARRASLSPTELLKEEGDDCYRSANFEGAIEAYTRCLDQISDKSCELAVKCYSNRGACFKQLSNFDGVIGDCTAVLEVEPMNVKNLIRRAQAFEAVERYRLAMDDIRAVQSMPADQVGSSNLSVVNGMQHRLNRVINQLRNA
jgi:stress-induced-phosphoprotein 1